MTTREEQFYSLACHEIADWNNAKHCEEGILAEVPILQRGLVWAQSQIELLWDSILRGIPIGSLVLCRINNSDSIQKQKKGNSEATHFIIDGQQRYNAISLGFNNFPPKNNDSSIIWLDLNPGTLTGTREFLVRLTTKSHPWGFEKSDDARKLRAEMIRAGLRKIKNEGANEKIDFADYKRPTPSEIFPFEANCPIPLSILLKANGEDFWGSVISELQKPTNSEFLWAKKAVSFIESDNIEKKRVYQAIHRAKTTRIIALNMPDFLLDQTRKEEGSESEDITNIEHLFQRLNRNGTTLDGEELVYSMIKSHFPEIARTIDGVADTRMPSSRLVQLSIRVALSDEHGLKGAFSVAQIRKIATQMDKTTDKEKVIDFINNELLMVAETVDKWLLLKDHQTWGIPRVLKTSIAIYSPDVYCLLLYLAWLHPNLTVETYKRITGIALFIHWFIDNKGKAVSSIYKKVYKSTDQNILTDLQESLKSDRDINEFLKRIQKPEFIKQIIDFSEENLSNWEWNFCKKTFLELVKEENTTEIEKNRISLDYEKYIAPLLKSLKENRELLLYAQRDYLSKRFPDYDPARKDLWKDINRPWDFDHILPAVYVYNKKGSYSHINVCKQFYSTIGNMRAWPFEDNRSDQATKTSEKMIKSSYWTDSFIDDTERDGYSDPSVIEDATKALRFANSCKSRIIRIYKEWFYNFNINELLT